MARKYLYALLCLLAVMAMGADQPQAGRGRPVRIQFLHSVYTGTLFKGAVRSPVAGGATGRTRVTGTLLPLLSEKALQIPHRVLYVRKHITDKQGAKVGKGLKANIFLYQEKAYRELAFSAECKLLDAAGKVLKTVCLSKRSGRAFALDDMTFELVLDRPPASCKVTVAKGKQFPCVVSLRACAAGEKQNLVVLVSIDSLRYDTYMDSALAPFMAELRGQGVHFAHAFSTSSWTLPAHMSMFTGLYPHNHGVEDVGRGLPQEIETITELLARQGYYTAGYSSNVFTSVGYDFERGFGDFACYKLQKDESAIFAWALQRLRKNPAQNAFVFLHVMTPHYPYQPPQAVIEDIGMTEPARRFGKKANFNDIFAAMSNKKQLQATGEFTERIRWMKGLYRGEVRKTDRSLSRFWADLAPLVRQYKHHLVIVTSDHGDEFADHGYLAHTSSLYAELTHVPLLVLSDGLSPAVAERQVSNMDVFALISDFCGLKNPLRDSRNPLKDQGERRLLAEVNRKHNKLRAVIDGTFCYLPDGNMSYRFFDKVLDVRRPGGLFAFRPDPLFQQDVAGGHKKEIQRLQAELRAVAPEQATAETAEVTEDQEELLKSLGYLH